MSHHYSGPDLAFPNRDARLNCTDRYAFPKPGEGSKDDPDYELSSVRRRESTRALRLRIRWRANAASSL